jgi:hypothetical protein
MAKRRGAAGDFPDSQTRSGGRRFPDRRKKYPEETLHIPSLSLASAKQSLPGLCAEAAVHADSFTACYSRLADAKFVLYVINSGTGYQPVGDSTLMAINCYVAMVHFNAPLMALI